ncbi:transglycosylase SLT domain-containing protein [Kozakia baliensis]|uniref:transglycosylase SLT domain-containing protein n=1 Tax=Kozakia baliensis TaxID=153496 RepID=UPI00068E6AB8|nr:transglycosylase SLT domain-containing protein [Kozakia baliensis]
MATDYASVYEAAGKYWNVDPDVLRAVHQVEDPQGDPNARSRVGATGHMQIMPGTAKSLGIDPRDPVQSIYGAARLLDENLRRYGNLKDALSAYNDGTDRNKWGNPETMAYPGKVAANYHQSKTPDVPDAFERDFSGVTTAHQAKQEEADGDKTPDAFDRDFGAVDADKNQLPPQARAHQGSWLGRMVQFGSDAVDAAAAEGVKAGANVIDGVTFHKLHGTEFDPRLFKKAAQEELDSQKANWGSGAAHFGGALVGDVALGGGLAGGARAVGGRLAAALPGTAGRIAEAGTNLLTGDAGNAATRMIGRGIDGAGTASLVDQNPLLGAVGGAASVPLGAVASRAGNALIGSAKRAGNATLDTLAPREAAQGTEHSGAASAGDGIAAEGGSPASAQMPPSKPSPEAIKLGLFTSPKHADKLAQRIWEDYQKGGPVQLVESKIPGVHLTAAQATGNPGLAQLERVRRAANPSQFTAMDQTNNTARNTYAQQIIGTPEQLQASEAARDAAEAAHRPQVFGNQQPVDVEPIREHLNDLINSNRGRDTVQQPLRNVLAQVNAAADEDGTALPEHLWNVRKYLNDMVSPRARGTANDGQAAAAQLLDLKPTITEQIEKGAPGFKEYLGQYEQISRPIDAMRFLQSRNLTNANGDVQLGRLDAFIKATAKERGKPGYREADSVTPEQLKALEDLRDDMRLASRIDLGRARGSDTNVNLTTTGRIANMAQGMAPKLAAMGGGSIGGALVGGPMAAPVGGFIGNALAGVVDRRIAGRMANTQAATYDALDNMLLNPRAIKR